MRYTNKLIQTRIIPIAVGLTAGGSIHAAGMDFSSITSGVDTSTIVTAIIAMGAVMMLPGVAKWAAKKLATFFG